MNFYEKDLEEIIFNSPPELLAERGLSFNHTIKKRQLTIGNYGRADIVAFDRKQYFNQSHQWKDEITIYELKKETISVSAFIQAIRYSKGIKRWIELYKPSFSEASINIVLIGKTIDKNGDLLYLPDLLGPYGDFNVTFYTYSYDVSGVNFKEHSGYKLVREGFEGGTDNV